MIKDGVLISATSSGTEGVAGGPELVVMTGNGVGRLSGVGPAIWHALATPCGIDTVAERIAPRIGLPAGYKSRLLSSVEELQSYGILLSQPTPGSGGALAN